MTIQTPDSVAPALRLNGAQRLRKLGLCSLVTAACLATSAAYAEPAAEIRVTEITETSHPFQTLQCARLPVQFRSLGTMLEVVVNNESRILAPVMSASGARYQAPGDPTTEFWGKGSLATITWSEAQLPQCAPAGTVIPPFRASGNEPFWSVDYDGWSLTVQEPGKQPVSVDARVIETRSNAQTIQGGKGENAIILQVSEELCMDTMSDLPRPQQVTFSRGNETLSGCGGDAARLLQGTDWKVVALADQSIPEAIPVWMAFLPEGRLVGNTGCNRFFGSYQITGEGISFGQLGSTRMACSTERMQVEHQFLLFLEQVRGFSFDADGALLLNTSEGGLRAVSSQPVQP